MIALRFNHIGACRLMADVSSLVPGGIYASIASSIWFACKETDSLVRQDVKEIISNFVSNNSVKDESVNLYNKMFALMYRSFFGNGPGNIGFWWRAFILSTIWLTTIYYFYLVNIKSPFFIKYTWHALPGYAESWGGVLGDIYFDSNYKYMIPFLTFVTLSIVSPYICDIASLALIYVLLRKIRNVKGNIYVLYHAAIIFILPFLLSFLGVVFSLFMALVYAERWNDFGLSGLISIVMEAYRNVLKFPSGIPPYKANLVIPIISVFSVISWSLLFTMSVIIVRVFSSRKFLTTLGFFNLKEKPFEAIGWVMIIIFTPIFWMLSQFH